MSVADLPGRPYKVIIGWPYLRKHRVLIDGNGPLAKFPWTRLDSRPCPLTSTTSMTSKPKVEAISPRQLKRLVRRSGPQCLGIAVVFDDPDPDSVIASLSRADLEVHRAALEKPKADPRTLLPREYYNYLDLCDPSRKVHRKTPRSHRKFNISLKPGTDIHRDVGYSPLRRMSDAELREVKRALDEHRAAGNISPSSAPIASPVLFVRKADGTLRFCVDYRRLNSITEKDRYPLPRIDEILRLVLGSKIMSKIDIHQAFHGVEVAESSRPLTTFRTAYGAWQWNVMPFGLSNAPSTWQRVINDALFDGLGSFCCAYVDDIIIWSSSLEQHRRDVRAVLERLREQGFSINIEKCEFHVTETRYLGHILSTTGIRPDPRKVQALLDWPMPRSTLDVHQFHGLGSYYRAYVEGFAKLAKPLTNLMRKDTPFVWTPEYQDAFEAIKTRLAEAVERHHFDPGLETTLATDASDGCLGAAMHQVKFVESTEPPSPRPVAFMSRTMLPAELNYFAHDKELLAIVRALEEWEPELLSLHKPFIVKSDHRALEYFMTSKKLNARQARWAEYLSRFDFKITYRPGCENRAADAFSRKAPSTDHDAVRTLTLLPPSRFTPEALTDLGVAPVEDSADDLTDDVNPIAELESANKADTEEMRRLRELAREGAPGYSIDSAGMLRISDKIYVPEHPPTLVARLIQHIHEQPAIGHPGRNRMSRLMSPRYYIKHMARRIARYLRNCPMCCKLARHTDPAPLLRPLPIPDAPWRDLSVDFVGPLPESKGYNTIMVVVDRFSKMRHYIPCTAKDLEKGTTAEAVARLFLDHVFRLHGLPDSILSDRGPQFVSAFWDKLTKTLRIKRKLSTAYHPQTDGQTERVNQDLENYLRRYVNWKQDDWVDWLSVAEYSANAAPSASTGISPFRAVYGYEPRMDFDTPSTSASNSPMPPSERDARGQAEALANKLRDTWDTVKESIALAQDRTRVRENESRQDPAINPGDLTYLSTQHLARGRPTHKLDYRWTGPYQAKSVHRGAAKLALPQGSKIHPVINLSHLRRYPNDPLPGQATEAESPDPVVQDSDDPSEHEFGVVDILDARVNRRIRGGRLQFRVNWRGWPDDPTWYNADDGEFDNAPEALERFYALPSTSVRRPKSYSQTPSTNRDTPAPPTPSTSSNPSNPALLPAPCDKPRDEAFSAGGGGVAGLRRSPRRASPREPSSGRSRAAA